jgi:hypothetical protein
VLLCTYVGIASDLFGHGYFRSNREVLRDISDLMAGRQRPGIAPTQEHELCAACTEHVEAGSRALQSLIMDNKMTLVKRIVKSGGKLVQGTDVVFATFQEGAGMDVLRQTVEAEVSNDKLAKAAYNWYGLYLGKGKYQHLGHYEYCLAYLNYPQMVEEYVHQMKVTSDEEAPLSDMWQGCVVPGEDEDFRSFG